MKSAAVLCMLAASLALAAATITESEYEFMFEAWRAQHSVGYKTLEEHHARYTVFKANLDLVRAHNSRHESWTMALNRFGDLTNAEFTARYVGGLKGYRVPHEMDLALLRVNTTELPSSVDWRTKGAVTGVKNQGQCGACWAFSTTGSVEGISAIDTGKLVSLSEQQLVDCSGPEGNMGCSGGIMDQAFEYIVKNEGLCSEADYPYTASDGTCKAASCTNAATITGYHDVPHDNRAALLAAIAQQPVSVAIQANQPGFQFYSGGVFTGTCGDQLDHGVLAVGYGAANGQDYWLIKNSWGTTWGMEGYIQLGRGTQFGTAGQCGLLSEPSYPTK